MNLPSCIAIFYKTRQKCTIKRLLLLCIFAVAPHAGAGIEINPGGVNSSIIRVAPHAGAGIEISPYNAKGEYRNQSPLTQGRELKLNGFTIVRRITGRPSRRGGN